MDRVQYAEERRAYRKPAAQAATPRQFDFGEWYFRWFGAGVLEVWSGGTHPAAQLWTQQMFDRAWTPGR